jgi:transcriptional regulator with XRE-family HTH domain
MPDRRATSLGEIIRQQRELAELSMRQFAELAGISNPYLSQIERGLRAPSQAVLDQIARTLKVSSNALYEQAGFAPPSAEPEAGGVLEAIARDPRLTARQRAALREIYQAFVTNSPRVRARGGGPGRAAAGTEPDGPGTGPDDLGTEPAGAGTGAAGSETDL